MRTKLYFLFFILLSGSSFAQDKIKDLIDDTEKNGKYKGSDVLTIFDSTLVDVQETGLSYFYIHQLYKVLTPKGAQKMSVLKYPYEPQSAHLEIREVKIYRKNGRQEILKEKDIYDYPAPGGLILWGAREQMAEVGRLEVGDAVEIRVFKKGYTYALLAEEAVDEEKFIPPMRGHYYDIVPFWSNQHVLNKTYQTSVFNDKNLQYEFYHGEVQVKVRVQGDKTLYTFTKEDIEPFKKEPNMLSLYDVAPKLILSTAPDWQSKSRWFYGVNEDFGSFEWTDEIKTKVDELLKDATDELDSVSRLTHWVADKIRYFGLTMGDGEGFTLHKADMTFKDRCGVCKDKAGLLICMLRAAGFESYAAMTMAGSRIDPIAADHFNHCVTAVKLSDGKMHMLDPTWVPFVRELWSSREQQQNYLIGTKTGVGLRETPVSDAEEHYVKVTCNSEIVNDQYLKGTFALVAEGQSDAAFRGYLTRTYKANWETYFEEEIEKAVPGISISELKFSDPYNYEEPFQLSFSFVANENIILTGNILVLKSVAAAVAWNLRNYSRIINMDVGERKYPFKDAFSKQLVIDEQIKIPGKEKLVADYIPEVKEFKSEASSVQGKYALNNSVLELDLVVNQNKRVYEVEDWADFRNAILVQKVIAEEYVLINIEK